MIKTINRKGTPTKPNKTKKATAADDVYTNEKTSEWVVNYFNPTGIILDPAAGNDAFFKFFKNENKFRCEIKDGIDFFDWDMEVDWIITNPPYSIYDLFLEKAFQVSKNVVFFVPIAKAFKSNQIQKLVEDYGGLKEIVYMGGGAKHGFGFGFPVGCLHYQRDYRDNLCKITNHIL